VIRYAAEEVRHLDRITVSTRVVIALTIFAPALAAAQSNQRAPSILRVEPYGPYRYSVTYGSIFGGAKSRLACVRDATIYCEREGKTMVPDQEIPAGRGGYTLIFHCEVVPKEVEEPPHNPYQAPVVKGTD
jgi:hypothetical protein